VLILLLIVSSSSVVVAITAAFIVTSSFSTSGTASLSKPFPFILFASLFLLGLVESCHLSLEEASSYPLD